VEAVLDRISCIIFRFVCDHDVDAAVAMMLHKAGHEAWTAADAGPDRAGDGLPPCKHIWLRCSEWDAADLLRQHLPELVPLPGIDRDLWIRVSADGLTLSLDWK
jgi:hypothetical protein